MLQSLSHKYDDAVAVVMAMSTTIPLMAVAVVAPQEGDGGQASVVYSHGSPFSNHAIWPDPQH